MPTSASIATLRHAGARAFFAGMLAATLPAMSTQAATVNVSVTDAAGKPLPFAVVTLEPATGKAPFKPMTGVEVGQRKRQFTPQVKVITVGTTVAFPNWDTVRHQVYSFSPIKSFELKLYAGGPSSPVLFDKPGIATLGCNIHDTMAAWIVVVETSIFATADAQGLAHVAAVPPGNYKMRVWHPGLPSEAESVTSPLTVAAADLDRPVRLGVTFNPLAVEP